MVVQGCIEGVLRFGGGDVSDGAVQALGVVPVDPFQGFPFDLCRRFPGTEEVDDLGLEQADDALGQGVVVGISDTADGCVDAGLGQPLGVLDRQVLAAADALLFVKPRSGPG